MMVIRASEVSLVIILSIRNTAKEAINRKLTFYVKNDTRVDRTACKISVRWLTPQKALIWILCTPNYITFPNIFYYIMRRYYFSQRSCITLCVGITFCNVYYTMRFSRRFTKHPLLVISHVSYRYVRWKLDWIACGFSMIVFVRHNK